MLTQNIFAVALCQAALQYGRFSRSRHGICILRSRDTLTPRLKERDAMTGTIKKYARDRAGFSFSELMVVIALVGVLSAIALPNLLRSLPEKRLKGAARNLYADLQKARLQAVKENRNLPVVFDAAGKSYYFDANSDGAFSAGEFKRELTEYGDVSYGCGTVTDWNKAAAPSSGVTGTGKITFTKTGTADTDGVPLGTEGIIYLGSSNVNVCYAVGVTNFGSVKIKRQQGGGASPWE